MTHFEKQTAIPTPENEAPHEQASEAHQVALQKPKKRFDFRRGLATASELASVGLAIDAIAGDQASTMIRNAMMKAANLPLGNFHYSRELLTKVLEYSTTLRNKFDELSQESDPKQKAAKELKLIERFRIYTDNVIQQFIKDNCSEDTFAKYASRRMERNKDAYHVKFLGRQLSILKELVGHNRAEAYRKARAYVLDYILGISEPVTGQEQSVVDQLTDSTISWIEENMLPPLQEKIAEFAEKGFFRQFADRARSTYHFFKDWVSVPFSDASKDRMSTMLEPLAYMGVGTSFKELVPIMTDICSIGWNVSISKGMALELLATCAGTITFEAALLVASYGTGTGVSALKTTGMAGRSALTALEIANGTRMGVSLAKTAIRNPITSMSSHLNFQSLVENFHTVSQKTSVEEAGTSYESCKLPDPQSR